MGEPIAEGLTKPEFAARHKVSPRAVEHWMQKGLPSRLERRGGRDVRVFDPEEADPVVAELRDVVDEEGRAAVKAQKEAAELRKLELQGDKLSLEVALKTGKVLPAEDVHREWAGRVQAVTRALDALPAAVAPLCENRAASEVRAILEGEVRRIRNEFAAERGKAGGDGHG